MQMIEKMQMSLYTAFCVQNPAFCVQLRSRSAAFCVQDPAFCVQILRSAFTCVLRSAAFRILRSAAFCVQLRSGSCVQRSDHVSLGEEEHTLKWDKLPKV